MKTVSFRFQEPLWRKVHEAVLSHGRNEGAAFLTATVFETDDKLVLIPQTMIPAKAEDYLRQGDLHLQMSPLYVSRVLNVAESQDNTIIMVHSHPFEHGVPNYSLSDDYGEAQTSETISINLDRNPPVGSLLFGRRQAIARAWQSKKAISARVNVIGKDSFRLFPGTREKSPRSFRDALDRQLRAMGEEFQSILESIDIGIVGLGGTGSAVAEQLVRMGVRELRLVDHDSFEPSNLSRLYGSKNKDLTRHRSKVELVRAHLREINPKVRINAQNESVLTNRVLKDLANCDIIFSCLDRHAPRAVLNELSYQCYVPMIDCGVGLNPRIESSRFEGSARATLIGPGFPCLFCQELIRPEVIMAENLSPAQYELRRAQGYVADTNQSAPSVIHYTTLASSLALLLLTEFLSGICSTLTVLFDLSTFETIKLSGTSKEDCTCRVRLGRGFKTPFSVAD